MIPGPDEPAGLQHGKFIGTRAARKGRINLGEFSFGQPKISGPGILNGVLDRALLQMVEDLIAGETARAGDFQGLLEVRDVEIAHTPGEDLPRLLEMLEGSDGVFQGMRPAPVEEVTVQPIGLEASKRA